MCREHRMVVEWYSPLTKTEKLDDSIAGHPSLRIAALSLSSQAVRDGLSSARTARSPSSVDRSDAGAHATVTAHRRTIRLRIVLLYLSHLRQGG